MRRWPPYSRRFSPLASVSRALDSGSTVRERAFALLGPRQNRGHVSSGHAVTAPALRRSRTSTAVHAVLRLPGIRAWVLRAPVHQHPLAYHLFENITACRRRFARSGTQHVS